MSEVKPRKTTNKKQSNKSEYIVGQDFLKFNEFKTVILQSGANIRSWTFKWISHFNSDLKKIKTKQPIDIYNEHANHFIDKLRNTENGFVYDEYLKSNEKYQWACLGILESNRYDVKKTILQISNVMAFNLTLDALNKWQEKFLSQGNVMNDFKKIEWLGDQKQLAELFYRLYEKGWIREISNEAIKRCFTKTNTIQQVLKPNQDKKNKFQASYSGIFTPKYNSMFFGIRENPISNLKENR